MSAEAAIETVVIMLALGLASELVAAALRLPVMIVLVAAGIAFGPEALGVLELPLDSTGVEILLMLGVSFILFHGGLGLSFRVLSRVGVTLGMLAIPGVILTALVCGVVAQAVFSIPFSAGFLIGAVLAPTDPAILIPLFERIGVRPKVSQTVVAESALNDPTGAVLALAAAAFVLDGGGSLAGPVLDFVEDLAISTALGVAFGLVLAVVVSNRRGGIWREAPAVTVAMVVGGAVVATNAAGGSGYLGAFIAGLIVGNVEHLRLPRQEHHERELETFAAIASQITVLLVFVTLGASLPLGTIADHAPEALAVLAVLILVARPLVVLTCALPDRRAGWTRPELGFLAWSRETGVVPASIAAGLAADPDFAYADELLTVVALAIVVTLLLQATTKPWLAARLDLVEPRSVQPHEPRGSGSAGRGR